MSMMVDGISVSTMGSRVSRQGPGHFVFGWVLAVCLIAASILQRRRWTLGMRRMRPQTILVWEMATRA